MSLFGHHSSTSRYGLTPPATLIPPGADDAHYAKDKGPQTAKGQSIWTQIQQFFQSLNGRVTLFLVALLAVGYILSRFF